MTDFRQLLDRLRRMEALHARIGFAGERNAAANAINASHAVQDHWSRWLFTALLRHYGIEPFRYRSQRYPMFNKCCRKSLGRNG